MPVTLAFLGMSLLALLVVNLGSAAGHVPPVAELLGWLQPWARYDAGWYYAIAKDGYFYRAGQQSSVAFFPTYPLLMRAGGAFAGIYLAGVVLTVVAGLTSVLLLTRWCAGRVSRRATLTTVALLLVYPYSLFLYGAVYADAVFLACALGAFLLLERGHPWLAGLVGALATAGRPVGVAVAAGLAVRAVELAHQRATAGRPAGRPAGVRASGVGGWSQRARAGLEAAVRSLRCVRWSDAGVLVSGTGLAGYMAFQWVAFGNPVAFVATESAPGWNQGTGPRTWFKVNFFGTMLRGDPAEVVRLLVPALLCLGTLLLLPRIQRRFGWGYMVFTAIAVAIPVVGTKDFMGSGRYLLVAFPAFAVLGQLLAEEWPRTARAVVLPVSAVLLVVATAAYGQGFEVS